MPPSQSSPTPSPLSCGTCHQPILPQYYFCPNCGTKVHEPPLLTTTTAQLGIYFLSIILPSLCFLFIGKWKGIQYLKSNDKKARTIGIIACGLLFISTIFTFWYAYTLTQKMVQSSMVGINADLDGY
jgi:hypothetical protein